MRAANSWIFSSPAAEIYSQPQTNFDFDTKAGLVLPKIGRFVLSSKEKIDRINPYHSIQTVQVVATWRPQSLLPNRALPRLEPTTSQSQRPKWTLPQVLNLKRVLIGFFWLVVLNDWEEAVISIGHTETRMNHPTNLDHQSAVSLRSAASPQSEYCAKQRNLLSGIEAFFKKCIRQALWNAPSEHERFLEALSRRPLPTLFPNPDNTVSTI